MRVLYITGSCLQCNTSANMSHNSFVQGLIENNCEVDIIMSDPGFLDIDHSMPYWEEANYFIYKSIPHMDRLRLITRSIVDKNKPKKTEKNYFQDNISNNSLNTKEKNKIRDFLKYVFYNVLTQESPHYLSRRWLKNASKYKSKLKYDLVISNSSPESSHALAYTLLERRNITASKWIQIWEDPWYYEFYSNQKKEMILNEESRLLNLSEEIYYVSPLTLLYQRQYFPQDANKMNCLPLPYLCTKSEGIVKGHKNLVFGYFGDYYSYVRNLKPFYDASIELNAKVNIFGDSDENLTSTENINISGRVDIGVVNEVQNKTDILIHLCNLRGGQIPGKIYHYSGTKKPIIFILDGEHEEVRTLKEYFEKYNRYYFCNNTKESIKEVMLKFINGELSIDSFIVEDFSPRNVVAKLLENK